VRASLRHWSLRRKAALFSSLFGTGHAPIYDSLPGDVTLPHPASRTDYCCQKMVRPPSGAARWSALRGDHGLVVTNWHVVRDATGLVDVVFPDGFHSHATPLKVDQDWDLAALVVWKPNVEPVKIAPPAAAAR